MNDKSRQEGPRGAPLAYAEFVLLVAGLMALNALALDSMIPALPAIGEALGVAEENRRQLVISAYMFGFGLTQIVYGPLSDRFGRRSILLVSIALYALLALACTLAPSFSFLIGARLAQGAAAAASRVLVIAIVRDCFEGSAMARLMSTAHMVFLIMPVVAPAFGQLTLLVAPWPWIFFGLAAWAAAMFLWVLRRLPETLAPAHRRPIAPKAIRAGVRETLTNRQAVGYTLAFALMLGALTAYLVSVQQIMFDVFRRPELMAPIFAAIAIPMAAASWLNSRIVQRFGPRRIAHAGLALFTLVAIIHLAVALAGESLIVFLLLQGATMACFAMCSANFGALAMQPLGHVAGTASSVQGTIVSLVGSVIGTLIGQAFDGTTVPMVGGFAVLGAFALAIIVLTERGRLFGRG